MSSITQPLTQPVTKRQAPDFLSPAFNRFLFAPIGTDRYGAPLSVVSALARRDLDAWAEAAALACLPRDVAVARLSKILLNFDEIPGISQESRAIALRLIALLPGRTVQDHLPDAAPFRWTGPGGACLVFLMVLGLVLGVQYARLAAQAPGSAAASQGHGLVAQAADASPRQPVSPVPLQK